MVVFHVLRELQRVFEDLLVDLERIFCVFSEGDEACHEFIEDYAEGPEIHGERIPLTCECLRRHVVRSTDHGEGLLSSVQFLAGAQIYEFQVSVSTDHHVFWLEITIDEGLLMEGFDDVQELSSIKHGLLGIQQSNDSDGIEKLHSIDKLSQEVDIVLILIRADELHDKGRCDGIQGTFFISQMLL